MSKVVVSETDVLCGRDRLSHGHPGNRTFRRLVDERADTYKRSTNRHQKTIIIRSIIRVVQEAGGRFLTLEDCFLSGNIAWKEMDPQSTHQKVAHALRSKQSSSVKGSLRGDGLFDSCRSAGNASRTSTGSSLAQEAHAPLPPAIPQPSTAKRQSDLHFLDALIDQQESLLQNLHISVEFGTKDVDVDDGDDNQSQCSNASELTSSTSDSHTDDPYPLDDDTEHLVSADAERLLMKNISEERSTASTYFFTLEGTLAEF